MTNVDIIETNLSTYLEPSQKSMMEPLFFCEKSSIVDVGLDSKYTLLPDCKRKVFKNRRSGSKIILENRSKLTLKDLDMKLDQIRRESRHWRNTKNPNIFNFFRAFHNDKKGRQFKLCCYSCLIHRCSGNVKHFSVLRIWGKIFIRYTWHSWVLTPLGGKNERHFCHSIYQTLYLGSRAFKTKFRKLCEDFKTAQGL